MCSQVRRSWCAGYSAHQMYTARSYSSLLLQSRREWVEQNYSASPYPPMSGKSSLLHPPSPTPQMKSAEMCRLLVPTKYIHTVLLHAIDWFQVWKEGCRTVGRISTGSRTECSACSVLNKWGRTYTWCWKQRRLPSLLGSRIQWWSRNEGWQHLLVQLGRTVFTS
jgi:hypothetical protein